jgi:hypothetical protein
MRVSLQTNETLKVKPSIHGTVGIFIWVHQWEITLKKKNQVQYTYRLSLGPFPIVQSQSQLAAQFAV